MDEQEEEDYLQLIYNPLQHTPAHPFCINPACPCRTNQVEVKILTDYEQAGLATPTEIETHRQGRNF